MRKTCLALALLATVAMTVAPVAPSFAARDVSRGVVVHRQSGTAAITAQQLEILARSRPSLHARLLAHRGEGPLQVSASEARLLRTLTTQTFDETKGGSFIAVLGAALATPAGMLVIAYVVKAVVGDKSPGPDIINGFICFLTRLIGAPDPAACINITVTPSRKS